MTQLSLFAIEEKKKNHDVSSSDSSVDEEVLKLDQIRTHSQSYKFMRNQNLSNSAKVPHKKRNSSPSINDSIDRKSSDSLTKSQKNRITSKTSSESDELERDDDSGAMATSASKRHNSNMSSSENIKTMSLETGHKVSNFNNIYDQITEEKEKEESSPDRQRLNERKNSLAADLDLLMQ